MSLIHTGLAYLKEDGVKVTATKTAVWGLRKIGVMRTDMVLQRRIQLSKDVDRLFGSTVRYGPFRGFKLTTESWWSNTDRASQLLGIYEQEILQALQEIPKRYSVFIDLGAADGYYSIGVLINGLFDRTICFEQNVTSRNLIAKNAEANKVSDRIEIRGFASKTFYNELPADVLDRAVLFVDIEGAEFEMLDHDTFKAFRNSIVIVELHEWFYDDGAARVQRMRNAAAATHTVTEYTMTSRDLSKFPELRTMHDDNRWLLCSEGRGHLMTWLRFDPIAQEEK